VPGRVRFLPFDSGIFDRHRLGVSLELNPEIETRIARAQALAQWQSTLSDYRSKGWVQHGNASVVDPVASKKSGKTFAVTACIDVSALDVVDKSGKSVVVQGRPQRQRYSYQVEKAPQGFFVTVDTLKAEPCGA